MNSKVFAALPRTGLANRLLVWARAAVFAEHWNLPLYVHGWGHIQIGPWLRKEKSKRYYGRFFRNQSAPLAWSIARCRYQFNRQTLQFDPPLDAPHENDRPRHYVFRTVPEKHDYFVGLRGHEGLLRTKFREMIEPKLLRTGDALPTSEIAIHVRRGDFRDAGFALTEETYFVETLDKIKQLTGLTRATVFTDAQEGDLTTLLSRPDVTRSQLNHDLLEMLHLSQSQVLVTSLRSTFGYWSGFLSTASIILDPRHESGPIRDGSRIDCFEGTIEQFKLFSDRRRTIPGDDVGSR